MKQGLWKVTRNDSTSVEQQKSFKLHTNREETHMRFLGESWTISKSVQHKQ